MLTYVRRVGESLRIGDATVTVLGAKGKQICLAVKVPPDISVQASRLASESAASVEIFLRA